MLRKTCVWLLAASLAASATLAQTPQTADELIEKNLAARGGKDKIKAINTVRMTGKMVMGQGQEAPIVLEMARPNKVRVEFTIQGMTGVQAYDGKSGWTLMPFMGKTDPEPMPAEELKLLEEQADFDGPLVDYKEKGHQVEYAGKEDLEGSPVHKLKVTRKSGDVAYFYIDAEQFLEVKQTSKTKLRGQELEGQTTLGDYKEVGGVLFPHSIEQQPVGAPGKVVMTLEKIEINPEVPATRFEMPAATPKTETKEPAPPGR